MQLVVPRAVSAAEMMLAMIWRMVFHVFLLFFMVINGFRVLITGREPRAAQPPPLTADAVH